MYMVKQIDWRNLWYASEYQVNAECITGLDILAREATLSEWFYLPSEKESTLKGKNLLPRLL